MMQMLPRELFRDPRALVAALAVSLLLSMLAAVEPVAAQSAPPRLFDPVTGSGHALGAQPGGQPRAVLRGRSVSARSGVLTHADGSPAVGIGQRVGLNLFDDVDLSMTVTDVTRHVTGGHTWSGTLDGIDLGSAILAVQDGAVVGHVVMPGAVYRIGYAPDGTQVVEEIDQGALPREAEPVPVGLGDEAMKLGGESSAVTAAADSASQIDVMVVFTAGARAAAGGVAAMQAEAAAAVASANQAYANNGLVQRLRVVFSGEVPFIENNIEDDLDVISGTGAAPCGNLCLVLRWLRDASRADIVSLLTQYPSASPFCGIGFLMVANTTAFAPNAFNIVDRTCATAGLTYAHENGHNMGAHHDAFVAGSDPTMFPYSHGYVDLVGKFRTIMAYPTQCTNMGFSCTRIPFFSTPGQNSMGRPMGNALSADNERTLSQTANTVANFRQALTSPITLTTGVNQSSFAAGETLMLSAGVTNPGVPGLVADAYLGLMGPDGVALFFTGGIVAGDVRSVPSYRPLATGVPLGSAFSVNATNFVSYQRTGSEPTGGFVLFFFLVKPGSLADGVLNPDDLIAASLTPFTFLPSAGGGCNPPFACK